MKRRSEIDRKSTRLNSSHLGISYAVFCLKKKKNRQRRALPHRGIRGALHVAVTDTGEGSCLDDTLPQRALHCILTDSSFFFFFNDTATTEIYPLPLHDALPI